MEQEKPQLSTGSNTPPTSGEVINNPIESRGSLLHDVRMALKNIVTEIGGFSEQDMDCTKSLVELLRDRDRRAYVFFDPHFWSDKRSLSGINQMTEYYVLHISRSKVSPLLSPSFDLADDQGWSIVAFEAAQQLMVNEFEVKGHILIGSPNPIHHEPLPNEVIANIIKPEQSELCAEQQCCTKGRLSIQCISARKLKGGILVQNE